VTASVEVATEPTSSRQNYRQFVGVQGKCQILPSYNDFGSEGLALPTDPRLHCGLGFLRSTPHLRSARIEEVPAIQVG
jgi:hypothetical protein